jgi:hypothetical protein
MAEIEHSERIELNNIANHWTETGNLAEATSCSDVSDLGDTLYEQLAEWIEEFAESSLTRREAEVWVLSTFLGEDHEALTDGAIALLLATSGSPFGEETDSTSSEEIASEPTIAEVEKRYEQAENKYEQAEQLVGSVTHIEREEHLDSPRIAWLDHSTRTRLHDRRNPDERIDDIVNRLLDETETHLSLEEFTRSYLEDVGRDNVAQLAVSNPIPEGRTICLTAHTRGSVDIPEVVSETDAVTIDGERYQFHFDEDPYGPKTGRNYLSLYASDNIVGMDAVTVDEGIETARSWIQEEN